MIHRTETVGSTQDIAHELAQGGAEHGTAVIARQQYSGRGTRGRAWHAGTGGLWMSVVLRPASAPSLECLSIRVGLAVAAALEPALGPGQLIQLKWPNDLLVAGRKLGGVLCEARWTGERLGWAVVGIGINVANQLAGEIAPFAVRLADLGGPADPGLIETSVREAILAAGARSGQLSATEVAAFGGRNWLEGRRVETPVRGVAGGIRPDGRLIIRLDNGSEIGILDSVGLAGLAQPHRSH